jgi:hypothetical protein
MSKLTKETLQTLNTMKIKRPIKVSFSETIATVVELRDRADRPVTKSQRIQDGHLVTTNLVSTDQMSKRKSLGTGCCATRGGSRAGGGRGSDESGLRRRRRSESGARRKTSLNTLEESSPGSVDAASKCKKESELEAQRGRTGVPEVDSRFIVVLTSWDQPSRRGTSPPRRHHRCH